MFRKSATDTHIHTRTYHIYSASISFQVTLYSIISLNISNNYVISPNCPTIALSFSEMDTFNKDTLKILLVSFSPPLSLSLSRSKRGQL